jgi:hypothetical protein
MENAVKMLNDKKVSFLTTKGKRTPKYIWQGRCYKGELMEEMTKKGLISHLDRLKRLQR